MRRGTAIDLPARLALGCAGLVACDFWPPILRSPLVPLLAARAFFVALGACVFAASPLAAEERSAQGADGVEGGDIAARRVGDHVLIRAFLRTEAFQKETHVVIDYAGAAGLAVHQNVLPAIAFGEGEATLKVVGEGFRVAIGRDDIAQESGPLLTQLTARHANVLENIDAAAIIGWPTLRRFALRLNLADGALALRPAASTDAAQAGANASAVVGGVRMGADTAYVPLTYNGGTQGWLAFGTAGHHTFINAELATALAKPDGGARDIRFGNADGLGLSGMTALFPQPFTAPEEPATATEAEESPPADAEPSPPSPPPEPLLLRSGLSLWAAYQLEINPLQGYLALTPMVESNHSAADAAFYSAAASKDAEALRAYAAAWPEDRNIEEAAKRLFAIGLETGASVVEQMRAVALGLGATPESRRMNYVAEFAAPLFAGEERDAHTALIIALCEEALTHVSRSYISSRGYGSPY